MKALKLLSLLSFLLMYNIVSTYANTYTVTSNATGVPTDGISLRWAITQAVANPGADIINFNIFGPAPHIITINSALPTLSGANAAGTTIDGSTQPSNGFSGVSPKIIIDCSNSVSVGLSLQSANCTILGLCITHFTSTGIQISTGADNFVIGSAAAGNVINSGASYGQGISINGASFGVIKGNKIGTDTTGYHARSVYTGIQISGSNTHDILIGGSGPGEGNLIAGQIGGNSENIYISGAKKVTIKGNIIGPDINGNNIHATTNVGIYLFAGADSCIIGGSLPGEGNIIAYNEDSTNHIGGAIEIQSSQYNLVSRNSIYCNGTWGGIQLIGGNGGYSSPNITSAFINIASGTAVANAIIELFYNHTGCTHTAHGCSGQTYIATVTANSVGDWYYTGTLTGGSYITATATDPLTHNTSTYANCMLVSTLTGINDITFSNNITIYPNPASDIVNLDIVKNQQGEMTLSIYNIIGKLIRTETIQQNQLHINTGDLNNGIYLLEIKFDSWSEKQKLIIQR